MPVRITGVKETSSAARHGILPGELLISPNGHEIMDVLDYRFYEIEPQLAVVVQDSAGKQREVVIPKREYDEIGLEFETYLMDKQHSCRNRCIFCFIDQMPKGLRKSLYFKDDDSRLSFLFGNYITLTNLSEHEVERIIQMHISPINVSVHTTNPELRARMMGNRFAGKALDLLNRFAQAQIKINCQLVLCPGINDGQELERTLHDLEALIPAVQCVAAVPVGVTKFRQGLYPIRQYTKESAREVLGILERFGEECRKKHGTRMAFAADEFYLKAQIPIPEPGFYEDFAQLENGVGMLALLKDEFLTALQVESGYRTERSVTIATGVAAGSLITELAEKAQAKFPGLQVRVVPIKNHFFGETITVSGLITGNDLIEQLKPLALGEELLIPSSMLRSEGDLFLDDISIQEASRALNVPVRAVESDGYLLLNAMIGE